jgi:hypothetical protein
MPTVGHKPSFARDVAPRRILGQRLYRIESEVCTREHYDVDVSGLMETPRRAPECPCKGYQCRGWCTHCDDAVVMHVRRVFHHEEKAKGAELGNSTPP